MSKVSVFIEEHLVKELVYDIPDEDSDVRMQKAEEMAREAYAKGEVVLTADDFNGERLIMTRDNKTDWETEWTNY